MYSHLQRMLRERVHLRGRVCVPCVMQVDTSVPVSCAAATCASMCIDGAQRTTLNVPGAAPKFSGGISRRDKKTIRPVRAHRSPQGDLWETVKRPGYFRISLTTVLRVISRTVTLVTAETRILWF